MQKCALAAAVLAPLLMLGCGRRDSAPGRTESQRLQGSWLIEAVERDGQSFPKPIGARLIFAGDQVTFPPEVGPPPPIQGYAT